MYAAIYAWKAIPGREERFRAGWRRVTEAIRREHGSFGSRLHRTDDGRFVAYALWPSEEAWKAAMAGAPVDPEGAQMMTDSAEPDGVSSSVVATGEVLDDLLLQP
ncbi:putative quinol monooxygenase [Engelhardtia mirabilis]|uniref:Antibiotic biosynthesis monooxygenase n=1 Tax=Engelhardtia mirabilis TaxID=2528011 RepID=A0A518BF33_9BACT|nr:Antibiotic biosynthesis monooxygenase [Planctomycetes bacterium Pla133]QDU99829.1 Antibiotic biosynthesis monooxygenase [Planctomycetes bacterium Pla86]